MKEKTVLGGDHQFLDRQFFLLELAIDKRKVPSSDLQESWAAGGFLIASVDEEKCSATPKWTHFRREMFPNLNLAVTPPIYLEFILRWEQ